MDATNSYAYATSVHDNTVWQYSIGSGGVLTPSTPNFVSAGAEPDYILVHPTTSMPMSRITVPLTRPRRGASLSTTSAQTAS